MRLSNLRKLQAGFDSYLSQDLSLPFEETFDLGEIARSQSPTELTKILELVIYAVIRCHDKEKYIGRILQLTQQCQSELMVFIETVLAKFERRRASMVAEHDEEFKLSQVNLQLTRDVENLTQELLDSRTREEDLKRELEDLKGEVAKAARRPDSMRGDLEGQLAEKTAAYVSVSKQLEELGKAHEYELAALRDDLDIANERLAQTSKVESALETYKKKAEEGTLAKKKLKEVETYNRTLQDRVQTLEEERATLTQLQHSLSIYKDQLTQEKERSAALSVQLQTREKESKELQRERIQWEERRQTYETKLQRLNEELERAKTTDQSDDSISLRNTYGPAELEEQLKALEVENRRLQLMIGNEELVKHFNEQIDAALIGKKQLEERLKLVSAELTALRSELEDGNLREQTLQSSLTLVQAELRESEEKCARLETDSVKLGSILQENERLKAEKDGYMGDLKTLYRDKDELQRKWLEAREESRKTKEEASILQANSSARQAEVSPAALKQLETERDNLMLSVENSNLKLTLREKEDQVRNLQAHIGEMDAAMRKSLAEQRSLMETQQGEEVERLKVQLAERDKDLEQLSTASSEMKALWYKEEKLMVGVIHEIGVEVFKQRGPKEPSYLAQQRDKAAKP